MSPVPTTHRPYYTSCIIFSSCQICHPCPQRTDPIILAVLNSRHARYVTRAHNAPTLLYQLYYILVMPDMSPVPTTHRHYYTSCIIFSSCQICHPCPQRTDPIILAVLYSCHARYVTRAHNAPSLLY